MEGSVKTGRGAHNTTGAWQHLWCVLLVGVSSEGECVLGEAGDVDKWRAVAIKAESVAPPPPPASPAAPVPSVALSSWLAMSKLGGPRVRVERPIAHKCSTVPPGYPMPPQLIFSHL